MGHAGRRGLPAATSADWGTAGAGGYQVQSLSSITVNSEILRLFQ